MKLNNTLIALVLLLSSFNSAYAQNLTNIDLSNQNIRFLGTQYVYHEKVNNKEQVSFTRHPKSLLSQPKKFTHFNSDKAQTNTGITINFATDSNIVNLSFTALPKINRGSKIAVYQVATGESSEDILIKKATFVPKQSHFVFSFNAKDIDKNTEYKVVLPSLANLALTAFQIEKNKQLFSLTSKRKDKYIAMGDSISHGVGQGSASYLTYPYLIAQTLDMELFNLSVSGAQVSEPTAAMLGDFNDIKLISILVGYNDWNAPNANLATFKAKYNDMLNTTLALHPESEIYCITPLFTRRDKAKHSKLPIQAYRNVISDLVKTKQKQGKDKLRLIHGDKITSIENLRTDKLSDPVHLGVTGAKLFAEELVAIFNQ